MDERVLDQHAADLDDALLVADGEGGILRLDFQGMCRSSCDRLELRRDGPSSLGQGDGVEGHFELTGVEP